MQAVFLDKHSLDRDDLDFSRLLSSYHHNDADSCWTFYDNTARDEVIHRTQNAEIIVTNKVVLDEEVISQAKNLKLVCIAATGTNNVDIDFAKSKGIVVCNVRAYGTHSVVQHLFTLLLMLMRNIPRYQRAMKNGDWQRSREFCLLDYPVEDLTAKTIGIIGYGELGKAVAKMAEAFGMKVLIASHTNRMGRKETSLQDKSSHEVLPLKALLTRADIVSLHCPLTEHTRNLIGENELELMKQSAILINTARGGIVDEVALADALKTGKLGGAAVDVLAEEPPKATSPLLQLDLPNLVVTPHIAWASRTARQNLLNQVAENIEHFVSGTPRNEI